MSPENLGYVKPLDGLRAIAVIMVMFMHAHFQLGKNGSLGVDIFFALSGFLITTLLLEEQRSTNQISLLSFYIRRTFRLFPALYVMLLLVLTYVLLFGNIETRSDILDEIYSSSLYLNNISWIWGWGDKGIILGHTWSLAVEEQFYLIWPIIIVLSLRFFSPKKLTIGLAFFIPFVWVLKFNGHYPIISSLMHESLLIGCLAALLRWTGKMPLFIPHSLTIIVFIFLLVVGIFPVPGYWDLFKLNGRSIGGLLTVIVILGLIGNPIGVLGRVLSSRIPVYIGKISYALYLWHLPVFRWFLWHSTLPPAIAFLAKFSATFVLAIVSLGLIEKRSIRLGKRISQMLLMKNINLISHVNIGKV